MAQDDAERMREQETLLQPEHDTTSLGSDLKKLQQDIETKQLQGKIRLGLARGEIDPTPVVDEDATKQ